MFLLPLDNWASEVSIVNQKTSLTQSNHEQTWRRGRRKKNGVYKKSKGFMWGLFKGKNQCDCPKH